MFNYLTYLSNEVLMEMILDLNRNINRMDAIAVRQYNELIDAYNLRNTGSLLKHIYIMEDLLCAVNVVVVAPEERRIDTFIAEDWMHILNR